MALKSAIQTLVSSGKVPGRRREAPNAGQLRLEVALLSGRSAALQVEADVSLRQLKLDAGQLLQVPIATLNRSDGTMLKEEMMTIQEAALEDGEILHATAANVRVEVENEALYFLKLLDSKEPAKIKDAIDQVADLEVEGAEEMIHLFQLILDKAFATPGAAAACGEMIQRLTKRYPKLEKTSEEQVQLAKSSNLLLNVMQANFEELFSDHRSLQKKKWWSGCMQIFGYLIMRGLIPGQVAALIFQDLIGRQEHPDTLPDEDKLLSACELLEICGGFFEFADPGACQEVFNRLSHLARHAVVQRNGSFADRVESRLSETLAPYSRRAGLRIQEVQCLRACRWRNGA